MLWAPLLVRVRLGHEGSTVLGPMKQSLIKTVRHISSFLLFLFLRTLCLIFYRTEVEWIGEGKNQGWNGVRLFIFLNHTSLFELVYLAAIPLSALWQHAPRMVTPGADKTLNRPFVGRIFKFIFPNMISISRKRDHTWQEFLDHISDESLIGIAPEGRMLRPNGLDSEGKPMSIRGGVADVLEALSSGALLIAYSGGLHHVQSPGEGLPKLFKTIRIRFERLDIASYKESLRKSGKGFKEAVVEDLERRKAQYTPHL